MTVSSHKEQRGTLNQFVKTQFKEIFCRNQKDLHVVTLLFFLLGLSKLGYAATANTSVAINLTAIDACIIPSGVNSLVFNNYDPTATNALTATGSLSIQCSAGSTVTSIGLDNGLHASGTQRQMLGAVSGALLQYTGPSVTILITFLPQLAVAIAASFNRALRHFTDKLLPQILRYKCH